MECCYGGCKKEKEEKAETMGCRMPLAAGRFADCGNCLQTGGIPEEKAVYGWRRSGVW